MTLQLDLFGAFREYEPAAFIRIEIPEGGTVADVRAAVERYASAHWPDFRPALLRVSAFASESRVLRDAEAVPTGGRMAILPPVSGG